MPRGGKRENAGRKRVRPELPPRADKGIASRVLAWPPDEKTGWTGEEKAWQSLLCSKDARLQFDVLKYLTDRRDGKPAQGVFVGDTRESARELDFGDLPDLFAASKPGQTNKPN